MRHIMLAGTFCALLASPAFAAVGDKASAEVKNAQGQALGTVTLTETASGLLLTGELQQLPPGAHGFHIHAVGKCEPPFTSAGGHFNPDSHKHGFESSDGAHAGDLPNIHATADGKAFVDLVAQGAMLTGGAKPVLDQDGAALVVHAGPDDYKTDPAGGSGDRIACGVITPAK